VPELDDDLSLGEPDSRPAYTGTTEPRGSELLAGAAREATRRTLARYPSVFLPISRRRHPQSVLQCDTELVIDGFTRSATTFALIAFQIAQNGHVRVAHHLHSASHVLAAVRRGVPALVPIREPEGAVLSTVIREPEVPLSQVLRSYVHFYRRLLPLADRVVLADFQSVTGNFGVVTRRVNERFGTSFVEFKHTDSDVATVFELINERAGRPSWQRLLGEFLCGRISYDEYRERTAPLRRSEPSLVVPEHKVNRPSPGRQELRDRLRRRYRGPVLSRWRERAEEAYLALASAAS
jgi:hypothetical protein